LSFEDVLERPATARKTTVVSLLGMNREMAAD